MRKEILICRHAQAEDHRDADHDYKRELAPIGEAQMKSVSRFIKNRKIRVTKIYSSELVRARQSAEILRSALNLDKVSVCRWLNINSDPKIAALNMLKATDGEVPLFIGHNPDLSATISRILRSPVGAIRLRKGSLVRIVQQRNGDGFRLDFSIPVALMN